MIERLHLQFILQAKMKLMFGKPRSQNQKMIFLVTCFLNYKQKVLLEEMTSLNKVPDNPIIWATIGFVILVSVVVLIVILSNRRSQINKLKLKTTGCDKENVYSHTLGTNTNLTSNYIVTYDIKRKFNYTPEDKPDYSQLQQFWKSKGILTDNLAKYSSLPFYIYNEYKSLKRNRGREDQIDNVVLVDPANSDVLRGEKSVGEAGTVSRSIYQFIMGLSPDTKFFVRPASHMNGQIIPVNNVDGIEDIEFSYKAIKNKGGQYIEEGKNWISGLQETKIVGRLHPFKGLTILHIEAPNFENSTFGDLIDSLDQIEQNPQTLLNNVYAELKTLIDTYKLSGKTILIPPIPSEDSVGVFGFNEKYKSYLKCGDKSCWGAIAKMTTIAAREKLGRENYKFLIGERSNDEIGVWEQAFQNHTNEETSTPMS